MEMVFCSRNQIKFTRDACDKVKEKYPARCKGCDGPVACDPIDLKSVNKIPAKEVPVSAQGVCAKCGEEKTIVSRKLCGKCRMEEIKAGTIDQNYPAKRSLFKKKEVVAVAKTEKKKRSFRSERRQRKPHLKRKRQTILSGKFPSVFMSVTVICSRTWSRTPWLTGDPWQMKSCSGLRMGRPDEFIWIVPGEA